MNNDMQKHALHPFAIRFFENTGTDETISYALDSFIFFLTSQLDSTRSFFG